MEELLKQIGGNIPVITVVGIILWKKVARLEAKIDNGLTAAVAQNTQQIAVIEQRCEDRGKCKS